MNKKWYPCELHCHTLHSDGSFTVKELMETAKERQLYGICLTDHNTFSGYEETKEFSSPVVLKAIEWTTYFGHMPVLDCEKIVDWRDTLPDTIDKKLKEIRQYNGIAGIAHPFQLGTPICTGGHWDYNVKDFSLINYMEIWSEGEMLMTPANKRAKKWWLSLLDKGYRIAPTFGRDWHRKEGNKLIGACTCLLAEGELTAEKMKEAIRKGRTQITLGHILNITTDKNETVGDAIDCGKRKFFIETDKSRVDFFKNEYTLEEKTLRIISSHGEIICEESAGVKEITLNVKENTYYIFELWGKVNGEDGHLLTMTAPIYTSGNN